VAPNQITILNVYQAITMDHNLLHIDPKTNHQCIVGGNIQETLNMYYADIEATAFQRMNEITLQDITEDILAREHMKS